MSLTSKYRIAEQARNILVGGKSTSDIEVSIRELIIFVGQAFASIVSRKYFEGKNEGESHVNGNFIYPFEEDVLKDTAKGLFYSVLPATSVTLPYDMEVYQVSRIKDQKAVFVPVSSGFTGLTEGLESGRLEGRIGYFVEDGRIYYVNMDQINKVDTVLMKLVAPIGSVEDEDEINISDDIQLEIVTLANQLYQNEQQNPKDTVNDNVK